MTTTNNDHIILVADDDDEFRLLVRSTLEQSNYTVVEAESGDIAIKKYRSLQPSLVMLDVMMPELDGFEVCREIRQSPNGLNIPIVMITSLDDVDSIRKAFQLGATDFITKPVDWQMLSMRVNFLLRANHRILESIQMAIDASSNPAATVQNTSSSPMIEHLESQLGPQLLREFLGIIDESLNEINIPNEDDMFDAVNPKERITRKDGLEESNVLHIRLQEMKTGTEFINPYITSVLKELDDVLNQLDASVESKDVLKWIHLLLKIKPHSDYLGCSSLSGCIETLLFTQTDSLMDVMGKDHAQLVNEIKLFQEYLRQELSDEINVE